MRKLIWAAAAAVVLVLVMYTIPALTLVKAEEPIIEISPECANALDPEQSDYCNCLDECTEDLGSWDAFQSCWLHHCADLSTAAPDCTEPCE